MKRDWKRTTGIVLGGFLVLVVTTASIKNPILLNSKAATESTTISIKPAILSMPPANTFELWLSTTQKIGFVRLALTFDNTKLYLINSPAISLLNFQTVKNSDTTSANQTGRIIIAAGILPANKLTAPTGTILAGTLQFAAKTPITAAETRIKIDLSDSQIVGADGSIGILSGQDSVVTIVAPTPTMIKPNPTIVPTVTANPTPAPTRAPLMTPTMAATAMPTQIPTVTPIPTMPVNIPPYFETTSLPKAIFGWRYSTRIIAKDSDLNDKLTMTVQNLPAGLTLGSCSQKIEKGVPTLKCFISGKLTLGGNYDLIFRVKDSFGAETATKLKLESVSWRDWWKYRFGI